MKRSLLLFVLLALCRIAFGQNEPQAMFVQSHYQSCTAPFSVAFKDTTWSPVHSQIVFWRWDFGDGTVDSSGPVVAHHYLQKGIFRVKLTVRDQAGREGSYMAEDYKLIRIGAALQMPPDTYFCNQPQPVFRNLAAPEYFDSIGTYKWVSHTVTLSTARTLYPTRTGTYELYYTACDTVLYGITSISQSTFNPAQSDAGKWLNDTCRTSFRIANSIYTSDKITQVTWLWSNGSILVTKGLFGINDAVRPNFTTPGTYNARVNVRLINPSDMVCDTSVMYTFILPEPGVIHNSWNRKDTLFKGSAISLSAGNAGATYKWKSEDPSFTATTQTVALTKPGKYWVEIQKSGDIITDTINVTAVDFTYTQLGNCSYYADTYIYFRSDIAVPAGDSLSSITWDYGDGTSGVYYDGYSTSHYYQNQAGGTYTVVMDVRFKSGSRKSVSKVVTVNRVLDWIVKIQDDTVSTPGIHILTAKTYGTLGAGAKIKWWPQPRLISSFVKPIGDTIQAILPGLYVAHLIDSCGGIWSHDTVEVRDPFTSQWTARVGVSYRDNCMNTAVLRVNTLAPKGTYQVRWNTGATSDSIVVDKQGWYGFTFTDSIGKTRKDSANVTIYAPETATIEVRTKNGQDTLVAGPYDRNIQYYFYRNDTLLSTATFNFNNLYGNPIPGIYKVTVQNLRGCRITSLPLYYRVSQDSVAVNFTYARDKCLSQQINFTGTAVPSNNSDTVKNVTWNFGDGMTATYPGTIKNVDHRYNAAGTYAVSFTATTQNGRRFSVSMQVYIAANEQYTVDIAGDTTSLPLTNVLKLIDKRPANAFVHWSTGSTNDTIHVHSTGIYKVWLTDSCGNIRAIDSVQSVINGNWSISASVTGRSACGDSARLNAKITTPGTGVAYEIVWSNGAKGATILATISGTYYVSLKDANGNVRAADSVRVTLGKPFKARLELHPAPVPNNDTLIAYPQNSSYTGYYYRWYKDGNFLRAGNEPLLHNPAEGLYMAYVMNDTGCTVRTDTLRYKVPVFPLTVDFSYKAANCEPKQIAFTSSVDTQDSVTYRWNFGDGTNELFVADVYHTFLTPGTYNVTLTATTAGGRTGSKTRQLVISAVDTTIWKTRIEQQRNQCGDSVYLTASNTAANAVYKWNTGAQTKAILVTASGRYTVNVYDTCGYKRAADSVYITVNTPCLPPVDSLPTDTISIGNGPVEGGKVLPVTAGFKQNFNADNIFTVQLTLKNPGGRETGLQPGEVINLGSKPGTDKNVTMDVDLPDTLACATSYAVRVVASSPADTTAWSQLFTVTNQPPQPVITQRGDSLFTSGKYNWQWYLDNNAIEGATAPNYRARKNGSYTVESLNGNGCKSKSAPVSVIITAVGEVTLGGNKVKAFPNPSEGQVSLQFEKPLLKTVTVRIYNISGRLMYTRTTTQQLQPLDLSGMPKGYYLIELTGYGDKKVLPLLLQ